MTTTTQQFTAITLATALALSAFAVTASVASAGHLGGYTLGSDKTKVSSKNYATVNNAAEIKSNTGHNNSNGESGGDAGHGGNAKTEAYFAATKMTHADAGKGARGGNGGNGGKVTTGKATSYGEIVNDLNSNRTVVDGCACPDVLKFTKDKVTARSYNKANVTNYLGVKANTGYNDTDGGQGGQGGNGGDAKTNAALALTYWTKAYGGYAGKGGDAGKGGTIETGAADADGRILNVANYNVTRINR